MYRPLFHQVFKIIRPDKTLIITLVNLEQAEYQLIVRLVKRGIFQFEQVKIERNFVEKTGAAIGDVKLVTAIFLYLRPLNYKSITEVGIGEGQQYFVMRKVKYKSIIVLGIHRVHKYFRTWNR